MQGTFQLHISTQGTGQCPGINTRPSQRPPTPPPPPNNPASSARATSTPPALPPKLFLKCSLTHGEECVCVFVCTYISIFICVLDVVRGVANSKLQRPARINSGAVPILPFA